VAKLHHSEAGLLLVRNKTQVMIPLQKEITSIGRKQADIILDDLKVSAYHAEIRRLESGYRFFDMGSTNCSFVNRRQVKEVDLVDQDVLEVGMTTLCFFADIRDFHGQVEEVTVSHKMKPLTQVTNVNDLTTTTKTIAQVPVCLKILQGETKEKEYRFRKSHILIGRGECDVSLYDVDASRSHALIEILSLSNIYVRDLQSTNGTFVNDERIESKRLNPGDKIQVGNTILEFHMESEGK